MRGYRSGRRGQRFRSLAKETGYFFILFFFYSGSVTYKAVQKYAVLITGKEIWALLISVNESSAPA
jgi:hypothetical protein